MPGYLNRFIDIDLTEFGEGCFVRIHNPKVLPQSMLEPTNKVMLGDDGKPVDAVAAEASGAEVMCRLIKDWCVYDATDIDSDEQKKLELPATAEQLAKLPVGVKIAITNAITEAMPTPK